MASGTQHRTRLITATALVFAAVILTVNRLLPLYLKPASSFRSNSSEPPSAAGNARSAGGRNVAQLIDPRLKSMELRFTESKQYEGSGRNIFSAAVDVPAKRKTPGRGPEPTPTTKQDTDSLPVIRLKFFGFASSPLVGQKVFLSQDGEIFVAREGDIVD